MILQAAAIRSRLTHAALILRFEFVLFDACIQAWWESGRLGGNGGNGEVEFMS